jgi:steroid 5-alpha reductase family enzyme
MHMTLPELSLSTLPPTLVVFLVAWLVSLPMRDTGVVDVFWALGFAVAAGAAAAEAVGSIPARGWAVMLLTAVWAARLSGHIAFRNRGRGEDPRYAAWREEHGRAWPLRSLITVFLLQGVLCWIGSLPLQAAIGATGPLQPTLFDAVGSALWLTGFTWEAVADYQLLRFKRDPANRGRVLTSGLWAWSRHPNYFGELTLWWGFYFIAVATPGGWLTVVSPLLISFLLLRVSGVVMMDRLMGDRPGWEAYAQRTPAFWPRPPRSG